MLYNKLLSEFIKQQSADCIYICATQKLAYHLQNIHTTQQNSSAWLSPNIITLPTWTNIVHKNNIAQTKLLLTQVQQRQLWLQIAQKQPAYEHLLQQTSIASLLQDAYQLVHHWQISIKNLQQYHDEQTQLFVNCLLTYTKTCKENNWQDETTLIASICQHPKKYLQIPQNPIAWIGFDQFTPLMINLQKTLSVHTEIHFWNMPEINYAKTLFVAHDNIEQTNQLCSYIRNVLKKNPKTTIGIVSKNLSEDKTKLSKQITTTLTPNQYLSTQIKENQLLHINCPDLLSSYPLVKWLYHTLEILEKDSFSLTDAVVFLQNPYWCKDKNHLIINARIQSYLETHGESTTSLQHMLNAVTQQKLKHPQLDFSYQLLCIQKLIHHQKISQNRKSIHAWVDYTNKCTQILNLPNKSFSSISMQIWYKWKYLLEELVKIELISAPILFSEWVTILKQTANQLMFQPDQPQANIELLTPENATGLHFDILWLLDCDSNQWPGKTNSNPFIPLELQRQHLLPSSDPKLYQTQQSTLFKRLSNSGQHIIYSYKKTRDSGEENLISPLLAKLNLSNNSVSTPLSSTLNQQLFNNKLLNFYTETHGPTLDSNQIEIHTYAVKNQLNCAFKGFALNRLNAYPAITPTPGLNPAQRGEIIHQTLQYLFNNIADHQQLCSLNILQQEQILNTSIDKVLAEWSHKKPFALTKKTSALEHTRIYKLVEAWLELEKTRPMFKIHATEASKKVTLGNYTINCRIDRIDSLACGQLLIIDYKTGANSSNDWFGERPQAPQLPIYTLALRQESVGITYAHLTKQALNFRGISKQHYDIEGIAAIDTGKRIKPDHSCWQKQIQHWESAIVKTLTEYSAGLATLNPHGPITCQQCPCMPLCRIQTTGVYANNNEYA